MRWIVRKAIFSLVTLFCAITLTFFLYRVIPGNPVDLMLNYYMSLGYSYEEALSRVLMMVPFVPTAPLHEQYMDFLKGILTGDFGYSFTLAQPITRILGYAIPWTVFSVSISLVISFMLGTVIGMYIAYKRGSLVDRVMSFYASITTAMPQNILGFFLIWGLAIQLRWFPKELGPYGPTVDPSKLNLEFILSVLRHAALPVLTYVLTTIGSWVLMMKSSTISVLGEYYVTAAEARGLKDRRIVTTYVGRNAVLPLFTRFAISLGFMFGGALLIENLFLYPGVGRYLTIGIQMRDYPLVTGCFLITSIATVLGNLFADLLYSRLDPRIKFE